MKRGRRIGYEEVCTTGIDEEEGEGGGGMQRGDESTTSNRAGREKERAWMRMRGALAGSILNDNAHGLTEQGRQNNWKTRYGQAGKEGRSRGRGRTEGKEESRERVESRQDETNVRQSRTDRQQEERGGNVVTPNGLRARNELRSFSYPVLRRVQPPTYSIHVDREHSYDVRQ